MTRFLVFLWIVGLATVSCKRQKGKDVEAVTEEGPTMAHYEEGKKLMEQQCYLCHSPSTPEAEGRIAPPMIAVKAHYQQSFDSREAFMDSLVHFVLNPEKNRVKMKGATRRFGIMPKQMFDADEIKKIAAYLYDFQVAEPDWFETHWLDHGFEPYRNKEQEKLSFDEVPTYAEVGLSYALGTKKVLGANLMGTIQKKGAPAAVAFCNERAYPLTDSMAVVYNAKIKRVSDKPRNPNNKANDKELEHIAMFKQKVLNKAKVEPIVEDLGEEVQFYYPIVTNGMCLKCHGNVPKDIALDVQKLLQERYPHDKAMGYGLNEVRGIWSITFDKRENGKF